MITILHSADLHLGKPFGRFPEDVRARLRLAREGILPRLAAAARAGGARHVLLAGDTFDAETPSPRVIRQALNAIRAAQDITFVLLPGNHDSLAASELWATLMRDCPDNLLLALTPAPLVLGDAVLLPAPCTHRRPGADLTEALMQPTPEGAIRLGMAHGAITEFAGGGSEDGNPAVIPPDRAARAGLAYLALGDWHGQMPAGARQWYAGTPEPDSFRHGTPGRALLVRLAGPGAEPQVTPVDTGALRWTAATLDLLPDDADPTRLDRLLPPLEQRESALLRLALTGRARLPARQALLTRVAQVTPDFLWCEAEDTVQPDLAPGDLDLIDRAGALRLAAERLAADAADSALPPADRAIAAAALSRLFTYAGEAT